LRVAVGDQSLQVGEGELREVFGSVELKSLQ